MSRFTEHAQQILEAAESACRRGEACSETTILIGPDGSIHLLTDSDWPLDSLVRHHGAETGYRVSQRSGIVGVEGRQGARKLVMDSRPIHARLSDLVLRGEHVR